MQALIGKKVGFLGAGMMASAMIKGLISNGVAPSSITASDVYQPALDALPEGVVSAPTNLDVVTASDVLVVAVKPYMVGTVLGECREVLSAKKEVLVVSIAAGIPIDVLETFVPDGTPVVRCMPNTPCLVGQAAVGFALGRNCVNGDEAAVTESLFTGTVLQVEESNLDAVTAVSGSGPAYVFLFIEALADGGVRAGLSRQIALKLAAQTVKGAAEMQLETGLHPGVLKDQVCSPGGTTIAAVEALEKNGFRYAAMSAVAAANAKCKEMGGKKK